MWIRLYRPGQKKSKSAHIGTNHLDIPIVRQQRHSVFPAAHRQQDVIDKAARARAERYTIAPSRWAIRLGYSR
jgi:hypothetical protein